jgi:hypothetical protein
VNSGFWVQKLSGFRSFACVVSSCLAKFIHNKPLLTTCRAPANNKFTWWKLSVIDIYKVQIAESTPQFSSCSLNCISQWTLPVCDAAFFDLCLTVRTEYFTNVQLKNSEDDIGAF